MAFYKINLRYIHMWGFCFLIWFICRWVIYVNAYVSTHDSFIFNMIVQIWFIYYTPDIFTWFIYLHTSHLHLHDSYASTFFSHDSFLHDSLSPNDSFVFTLFICFHFFMWFITWFLHVIPNHSFVFCMTFPNWFIYFTCDIFTIHLRLYDSYTSMSLFMWFILTWFICISKRFTYFDICFQMIHLYVFLPHLIHLHYMYFVTWCVYYNIPMMQFDTYNPLICSFTCDYVQN